MRIESIYKCDQCCFCLKENDTTAYCHRYMEHKRVSPNQNACKDCTPDIE